MSFRSVAKRTNPGSRCSPSDIRCATVTKGMPSSVEISEAKCRCRSRERSSRYWAPLPFQSRLFVSFSTCLGSASLLPLLGSKMAARSAPIPIGFTAMGASCDPLDYLWGDSDRPVDDVAQGDVFVAVTVIDEEGPVLM